MPAYGVSRGNPYQSFRREYNPLRGDNTLNRNNYSSLHYQPTHNHHHAPQPTAIATNHESSLSLHPASNPLDCNPYLSLLRKNKNNSTNNTQSNPNNANNTNINLPDLSQPRLPPQPIATPPRNNTRRRMEIPQTQPPKTADPDANGWNFTAFSFIKSAWSKLVGTPSKKPMTKISASAKRSSMSQPPRSPLQQPPNPYAMNGNCSIPEGRPVTAPSPRPMNNRELQRNDTNATIPITPPQQTRPNFSEILSQASTATVAVDNNDDAKSTNTKNDGGSAVITIHNLLQQTKLSPDDAAWLHSKIDQVTHDRYDGSLSYIGPAIRAGSQGLVQQISFDDSATEYSHKSHSICSPLRPNQRANCIPSTISNVPRYQPHPDNYHKRNYRKNMGVAARKRSRPEVFDEEEEELMMESRQQRKKMKMIGTKSSSFVRRKAFRDNYLRPIGQTSLYPFHKIVPKYNDIPDDNRSSKSTKSTQSTANDVHLKQNNQEIVNKEKNDKINDNGFYFDKTKKMDTDTTHIGKATHEQLHYNKKIIKNGFGGMKPSENSISEDISSENMEVDIKDNKPLKRRHRVRSPLKDKKPDNTLNKIQKQETNDDDDDLLCKKKINDDDDVLKKMSPKKATPQKANTPKGKTDGMKFVPPSTPISDAFSVADEIITKSKTNETTNNKASDEAQTSSDVEINDASATEPKSNEEIEIKETANENTTATKAEEATKKESKRPETYLMKLMRERKERYIEAYRQRLTRIYSTHQAAKLDKVDGFIKKFGRDVDDIHDLYVKVCKKYSLKPCAKYDGSEHEPTPSKDEKEKPKEKTPEQKLSPNLTTDDTKEGKKDKEARTKPAGDHGFKFVAPSTGFKFSQNTETKPALNINDKVTEQKENETNKAPQKDSWSFSFSQKPAENKETKQAQISFENAANPFAKQQKSPNKATTESKPNNTWSFSTATNGAADGKKDTWSDKKPVSSTMFSMPSTLSFSAPKQEKKQENEAKVAPFTNTNNTFKFSDASQAKPSFGVSKTEVIADNNLNNESNSKKRRFSLDNNNDGKQQNNSNFSWPSNNDNASKTNNNAASMQWSNNTKTAQNASPFSWDKKKNDKETKPAQNNPFKQSGQFSWDKKTNDNKTNEKNAAFSNGTNNNNNSVFSSNNAAKNSTFSWGAKPNTANNNNPPPAFGASATDNNTFNAPFGNNNNNNNKPNGWGASNNAANNSNGFGNNNNNNNNSNGNSGWNFGGNNTNNINNNNNNNADGGFKFNNNVAPNSNAPPTSNNNASGGGGAGGNNDFFTMQSGGSKKRPVFKAKRRNRRK